MADTAEQEREQERRAKAERAKKLLAAQKKKKKAAAAAAAVASTETTSQAPSSEVGDSPRASIDGRAAVTTPLPTGSEPSEPSKPTVEGTKETADREDETTLAAGVNETESDGGKVEKEVGPGSIAAESTTDAAPNKSERATKKKPDDVVPSGDTSTSTAELASLRETITSLTTENATLVNRLTTLENTISTLRTDAGLLTEARAENARLEEESRELRSQLEVQGTKLAGFERIKEDMDAVRAESEDAASRAIKSEGEMERLEKEVERLKKEVDEKDEAVKNQTEELETRLTRQREREGGLEAEVARLKQLNAEAESVQKDTEKTHFELKTEHDRVKSTLDSLQTTHDSLKSAHDDLGRSLAETQSSSGTLQRDLEAANKGRQAAELRVKEVEDALTASSASVISLKKQLDAATKRVEQGAAQRKGLKEDNEGLMSQLEEMRTRLSEVMQEKVGLVEGVQEGERMRAELEEVKSELERVRSEREGLERDLEQLRSNHSETEAEIERLRQTVASQSQLEEKAKQADRLASEREGTIDSLRLEVESAEARRLDLVARLEKADEERKQVESAYNKDVGRLAEVLQLEDTQDEDGYEVVIRRAVETLRSAASAAAAAAPPPTTASPRPERSETTEPRPSLELELSTLSARLRTTESSLHTETSRTHLLQRQLTDVQAEMARLTRERDEAMRLVDRGVGSSRTMMGGGYVVDTRGMVGSSSSPPPPPSTARGLMDYDLHLPPSARHKRAVSLQALRARMGPTTPAAGDDTSRRSNVGMLGGGVNEADEDEEEGPREGSAEERGQVAVAVAVAQGGRRDRRGHRRQFGDEVVFWCPCCTGDLITL